MNVDEERFQRTRRNWLGYGRALLTFAVLCTITITIYYWAHSGSHNDTETTQRTDLLNISSNYQALELKNSASSHKTIEILPNSNENSRIKKRSADRGLENAIDKTSVYTYSYDVDSEMPKIDDNSENLANSYYDSNDVDGNSNSIPTNLKHNVHFKRQEHKNVPIIHKHQDGHDYVLYKKYNCVPYRVPRPRNYVSWHRNGTCFVLLFVLCSHLQVSKYFPPNIVAVYLILKSLEIPLKCFHSLCNSDNL